jgi:hypothetical protein
LPNDEEGKMLEGYNIYDNDEATIKMNRLIAVRAALEIAKASVVAPTASVYCRTGEHLEAVSGQIESLASAIQKAVENK